MNTIRIMQESQLISLNSTTIILQKVPNQRQPCVSLPIIWLQCQTLFEIYLGFFVTLQVTHCRRLIGEINVRIGPSGTDLQRVCVYNLMDLSYSFLDIWRLHSSLRRLASHCSVAIWPVNFSGTLNQQEMEFYEMVSIVWSSLYAKSSSS